jgi:hypothetical protein
MNMHESDAGAAKWGASGDGARGLLQLFRQQLRGYADVPAVSSEDAPRAQASVPVAAVDDLPAELRQLLQRYEQEHPSVRLEPVRYVSVGVPREAGTLFSATDLPGEEELVVLVITETVASMSQVEVRSRMLLARQRPAE